MITHSDWPFFVGIALLVAALLLSWWGRKPKP